MERALIYFICFFVLCSCSTTYNVSVSNSRADDLVGRTETEIVQLMGTPDRIFDYEQGYIMVYEGSDYIFYYNRSVGQRPRIELYMTASSICQRYRISNTQPVKQFSPGKTLGLLWLLR